MYYRLLTYHNIIIMEYNCKLICLAAFFVSITNSINIYRIVPNDGNDTCNNTHTLECYINNYNLTSSTELLFKPGQHYLNTTMIVRDVQNFTMIGKRTCNIACAESVRIIMFNVTNFRLENIDFQFKNNPNNSRIKVYSSFRFTDSLQDNITYNASIVLYQCMSVIINKTEIKNNVGIAGIAAVNIMGSSIISQVTIKINCKICPENMVQINGIVVQYKEWVGQKQYSFKELHNVLTIRNLVYKLHESCTNPFQYAINLTFSQKSYNASKIHIRNVLFNDLNNSSALYYYMNTCDSNLISIVNVSNCTAIRNVGNPNQKMFHVVMYSRECVDMFDYVFAAGNQYLHNQVDFSFHYCTFINNSNMKSMIYIEPSSSRLLMGSIKIQHCNFSKNRNINFITVESEKEIYWQLTNRIFIRNTEICSNTHNDSSNNLISVTNTIIILLNGSIFIRNNTNYNSIFRLQLSLLLLNFYIEVSSNNARQVLVTKFGSYVLVAENTKLNISYNTLYNVAVPEKALRVTSERICPFQFHKYNRNNTQNYSYHPVVMIGNLYMTSKNLQHDDETFGDCQWLAGTAFQTNKSKVVFKNLLIDDNNMVINQTTPIRPIPLSVCKCSNNISNCFVGNLGEIFPGQILRVELTVPEFWLRQEGHNSTTLIVKNSQNDECAVVDTSQLSQTHIKHGCNQYNYTLWPSSRTTNTCKLFLGLDNMPEMFYVELKRCPKGFTLQVKEDKKACSCDPIMQNSSLSITSCNLDDETVLRPANSWINATDNSHGYSYKVSSACPFDYCLPYPSYLNLSTPDSQCQFNRSGVLCGQCQHGLSAVFGSSRCKHCSNMYLFIIIPIAIAGIILVTMLFIFNLTVLNETINTLIFYVNIININMLTLHPICQHGICTIILLFNLDLGIETCFYNGMDDYAIMWLQLAFPSYLIMIAILLIIGSRYSIIIQRATARRALPVLATIFLLSYTKVLRTVCIALFWYYKVILLPSNKTELFWSVDTTVHLFGIKFLIMFVVSFILFLILLPFNVVLLFPRLLSRFKFVSTFKPLLDTYVGSFKDKFSCWIGFLLLVRVIAFGLSTLSGYGSFLAISVLLGVLLCIQGHTHPFKNKIKNIQESLLLLNLMVIHVAPLYKPHSIGLRISQILLTVGVVYLILAITIHCLMFRCKNTIYYYTKRLYTMACRKIVVKQNDSTNLNHLTSEVAEVTYNYKEFQEPLIGLD